MRRFLFAVALIASPAFAATTSAQLENVAFRLMHNTAPNVALDKELLTLLREPAKTLEGRTLPTTAAQYTASIDTALKLKPNSWIWSVSMGSGIVASPWAYKTDIINCGATLIDNVNAGSVPVAGNVWAIGPGNCPSQLSAAIAKAWAAKLRTVGR